MTTNNRSEAVTDKEPYVTFKDTGIYVDLARYLKSPEGQAALAKFTHAAAPSTGSTRSAPSGDCIHKHRWHYDENGLGHCDECDERREPLDADAAPVEAVASLSFDEWWSKAYWEEIIDKNISDLRVVAMCGWLGAKLSTHPAPTPAAQGYREVVADDFDNALHKLPHTFFTTCELAKFVNSIGAVISSAHSDRVKPVSAADSGEGE